MSSKINLTVMVLDTDFYARQAVASYLAWDRRTRVSARAQDVDGAFEYIRNVPLAEHPDILLFDVDACATPDSLRATILKFRSAVRGLSVICLARQPDAPRTAAAAEAGARGYLLRNEVRLLLVNTIIFALERRFVITPAIQGSALPPHDSWLAYAELLPSERAYPQMTERIRQALWLCVVEGMPAQLAADEMGISPHTIRSYIKEGYRILEAHDDNQYPEDMGPIERAFMRFTNLNRLDIPEDIPRRQKPRRPDNED